MEHRTLSSPIFVPVPSTLPVKKNLNLAFQSIYSNLVGGQKAVSSSAQYRYERRKELESLSKIQSKESKLFPLTFTFPIRCHLFPTSENLFFLPTTNSSSVLCPLVRYKSSFGMIGSKGQVTQ